MKPNRIFFWLNLLGCLLIAGPVFAQSAQTQQRRPNIVLIFPDNLGWGEVGAYGSVRGVPTPRIDRLAAEGIRLTNFNVEFSCTVSRAALLTGRYAVRTGAVQNSGITQWEITIAEALKSAGYATALFGKWHLGGLKWQQGRQPTDQGFDEWYGIPMTSNEAQTTTLPNFNPATTEAPYIWEGKAGEPSRKVKVFDLETRRTIDREAALRGIDFMERNVKAHKPFFLYYPITQIHFPTLPHPDFAGKTGAGDIGDAMADVDYNTGLVLDALKRLGIERNTIVIWCTDNGAEQRRPWRGSSGPWSGFYNTVRPWLKKMKMAAPLCFWQRAMATLKLSSGFCNMARPWLKKIKMAIFPADDVDVDAALQGLHEACLVLRYVVDNERYIYLPSFLKHQSPHMKEAPSAIPAPDKHQFKPVLSPLNPESLFLIPESGNLKAEDCVCDAREKIDERENGKEVFNSKHLFDTILAYTQAEKKSGKPIKNPTGLAISLQKSGQADSLIDNFLKNGSIAGVPGLDSDFWDRDEPSP